MAGNIIPAIATTNAIIAAVIVMESLKILSGNIESCKAVSIFKHYCKSGNICNVLILAIFCKSIALQI